MVEQLATEETPAVDLTNNLLMVSGLALTVLGVGLFLSSPVARRHLGDLGIHNPIEKLMPDITRYFNLRSM